MANHYLAKFIWSALRCADVHFCDATLYFWTISFAGDFEWPSWVYVETRRSELLVFSESRRSIGKTSFRSQKPPLSLFPRIAFASWGNGVEPLPRFFLRFWCKLVARCFIAHNNKVKEFFNIVGAFLKDELLRIVNALWLVINCEHVWRTPCFRPIFRCQFCGRSAISDRDPSMLLQNFLDFVTESDTYVYLAISCSFWTLA